jgi:hypothetical protein
MGDRVTGDRAQPSALVAHTTSSAAVTESPLANRVTS